MAVEMLGDFASKQARKTKTVFKLGETIVRGYDVILN